jgi:hypothetical protein
MTRRSVAPLALAALILVDVGCTEVATNPNAVVALRFDGSAYPSIVAGDSLRDSLGLLQPLQLTALNYRGDPVEGAPVVFSSPDTIVRVGEGGVVFARGFKADAAPVRVFATVGTLQSKPDSLFVVPRADSIDAAKDAEVVIVGSLGGTSGADSLRFFVFGDTATGRPPVAVPFWLVSFQLRYKGTLIAPTDTTFAYTFEATGGATPRRLPIAIDTTDAQGKATRRLFVRSLPSAVAEDTIFLIATMRTRQANVAPLTAETMILLRRQ